MLITVRPTTSDIQFPMVVISNNRIYKRILLATAPGKNERVFCGIVLKNIEGMFSTEIGYYSETWSLESFMPYGGDVTLRNEPKNKPKDEPDSLKCPHEGDLFPWINNVCYSPPGSCSNCVRNPHAMVGYTATVVDNYQERK